MQWPDFSKHNVKLLKRTEDESNTHYFVVVPLLVGDAIEMDVKSAFLRYGFVEEAPGSLVAPLAIEMVSKLVKTPEVVMVDVDASDIDEKTYIKSLETVTLELIDDAVANINNEALESVIIDEPSDLTSNVEQLEDEVVTLSTQDSVGSLDNADAQAAALFSAQLKIVNASTLIHKSQSSGLLADIFIRDQDGLTSEKCKAIIWFEENTPFFAFNQGRFHHVIALTSPDDQNMSDMSFLGVDIIDQSISIPGQYESAFNRIASTGMNELIKHNDNGIFTSDECESIKFSSKSDCSSAAIYLAEHGDRWLSSYSYEFQIGNYAKNESLPSIKDKQFDYRETAAINAIDDLIVAQHGMLQSNTIESLQRNEVANILIWAGELKEGMLNQHSLRQSSDNEDADHLDAQRISA